MSRFRCEFLHHFLLIFEFFLELLTLVSQLVQLILWVEVEICVSDTSGTECVLLRQNCGD